MEIASRVRLKTALTLIYVDEEEQIEETIQQRNKKAGKTSKFERAVRTGIIATHDKDGLGFPNYFTAQKVRAKISQQDEKYGSAVLLKKMDNKK